MSVAAVRRARPEDAALLPNIERSAGAIFRSIPDLAWIADEDVMSEKQHRNFIAAGTSWVAEQGAGAIVGFLSAEQTEDVLHIWEISVVEPLQGKGVGRMLIDEAVNWARTQKIGLVTLTTFRTLAWNEPLYHRLGFETLDHDTMGLRLQRVLENELAKGMPLYQRCAMRRQI